MREERILIHHGIKGQQWGIRRYQNEDGSLTEEGKKRYGVSSDGKMSLKGKIKRAWDLSADREQRIAGQKIASATILNNSDLLGNQKSKEHRDKIQKLSSWGYNENSKKYAQHYLDLLDKYAKDKPSLYRQAANSGASYVASASFWAEMEMIDAAVTSGRWSYNKRSKKWE